MKKFFKPLSLLLFFLACLVVLSSAVFAENMSGNASSNANANSAKQQNTAPGLIKKQTLISQAGQQSTSSGKKTGLIRKLSGTPPIGKGRLEENRLRVCQVKEKMITTRSNNMVQHANRLIAIFDSIATRIQNYYMSRLVPQGKILPNYEALVLAIQTNRSAVAPLLEAIQTDVTNFSCVGDDPKGQLDQFKEDMHAVIAGLKTYKTSVRNLIVAVASIRGAGDGNATGSATQPSITPTIAPTAVQTL